MQVQPYLAFKGQCEEALKFYEQKLGGKITFMMKYADSPDKTNITPEMENHVMHANISFGETQVMAADSSCMGNHDAGKFSGFVLTLTVENDAEAKTKFEALAAGGKVIMPLTKTFFASSYGVVTDKFGMGWAVLKPLPMNS